MERNLEQFIIENYNKAIKRHEIQPFYQPVIRASSGQLCSFEALARWIDPELGMIFPDEFIPVMERERLIHLLDAEILRQVCARIRAGITNGETPVPVSVNLSRLDFTLCDIFSIADQIVSEYQIPHDMIYFEITESVMAEQKELMKGIVDRFRAAGYQIWMDDFGSAYSSLNALKEFSFDELKLDMCFLHPFNQRSKRIATAVVEMAKGIDIHTLAEGVETEEQYYYLRNIGCEKLQGYFFGKPMPYDQVIEHLRVRGIRTELPQDRKYYDDIGKVDYLSAVPFMTREDRDALVTARQLNSIPLALVEFGAEHFSILFYNSAFEETASGTGMFSDVFTQDMLCRPRPNRLISDKFLNLMDAVKLSGDGRMLFTFREQYYEVQARRVAQARDRYCVLVRITNLTKDTQSENTGFLDEFARRIYALYERITLINLREDTIRPLYVATREDLLSGRKGIRALTEEYAEKLIYPDDREKYLAMFDPDTAYKALNESNRVSRSEVLRTSIRHGQYAWKEYTLLKVDDGTYLMLTRDVHDSVLCMREDAKGAHDDAGPFSAGNLWNDLNRSGLLRMFWKDGERRFVGASRAFLDYYGFPSVDVILGKTDEDVGWHIHPDRYMNDELRVIHEGVTLHNIPGHCMNDGENREILASKTPLYDENGEIKGLLGYFVDRELLKENDKRGDETTRRDMLTGLLNSRGITEEAAFFRDEYYLRGIDFARVHIAINDFNAINEQYGFDFGDKVLNVLGTALRREFGKTCAVGRYTGHKFVVLHQAADQGELRDLRTRVKSIGESIREIDGIPLTLYLSVGYTFFTEYLDLDEQTKMTEVRLLADHDQNISEESRLAHASQIFHLFDDLPISYSVYHVTRSEDGGRCDAVVFYVNHKYEEYGGASAKAVLGRSVRELYPFIGGDWFRSVERAAMHGESVEGVQCSAEGKRFRFTARQIIYAGYCAVTYQEIPEA